MFREVGAGVTNFDELEEVVRSSLCLDVREETYTCAVIYYQRY